MVNVYTASKLAKRAMWGRLAKEWEPLGIRFHARWYSQVDHGVEETAENAEVFWVQDHEDAASADAILVYGEEGDHLRGALVEAGIGIALGIPVVVVGDFNYGTWIYHPGVTRVANLEEAGRYLSRLPARLPVAA
jgi:hypothetical protein